jgi:FtsZ-binding cell division protein ZapB
MNTTLLKRLRADILNSAANLQASFPQLEVNDADWDELDRIRGNIQYAVSELDFACLRIQRLIEKNNALVQIDRLITKNENQKENQQTKVQG